MPRLDFAGNRLRLGDRVVDLRPGCNHAGKVVAKAGVTVTVCWEGGEDEETLPVWDVLKEHSAPR